LTRNPDALTEFPGDQPEPKGRRAPGAAGPPRAPRALRPRAKGRAVARRLREQQGNAAVELAPVAVVFLLFLALAIAAGRITIAHMAVQAAARDAARQASIARSPAQAQAAARASAETALRSDGLDCTPVVSVNTAGFTVPVGQPAQVTATVTCTVRLSDLTAVPGMPGARTLTATVASALDPYRAR
jgi:Flp pilus assembly protein TadG